jgi:hypothetical protein
LQTGLALLQGLVFDLRRDLDDLRFRLEILDDKASQFLHFLSAMQGALHPPAEEAQATGAVTPVLAPTPPLGTSEHDEPGQEENMPPAQPEDAMQLDRTPVEEEPTPLRDSTLDAFFLDAWLQYNPTT